MSDRKQCLNALGRAVVEFKAQECKSLASLSLTLGIDPTVAVLDGLGKGMEKVSMLYDTNQYFVPEVLLCAEALYEGLGILQPHIKKDPDKPKAVIVMGSVQGDIHEIGKNLVRLMFDAAGWEVHDLGCDVPPRVFFEKQNQVKADILAMSAMMTTTMMGMKKVIQMVKSQRPECLIMVGGAPLTQDFADFLGADGFAPSAGMAVSEALAMIDRRNNYKKIIS